MISDEEKERVRQATDVLGLVSETVELKRRGHDYWGCCPFHHEKSASFHVNPSTGLWKCFGCGKGGDVFAYVMQREKLDFPDSIRYLADKANIELKEEIGTYSKGPKKKRIYEVLGEAEEFYNTMLCRGRVNGCNDARSYLGSRGFGLEICKDWKLGYAPGASSLTTYLQSKGFTSQEMIKANLAMSSNYGGLRDRFFGRVMFPIHDESGRCIGFGGRVLDSSQPKYLNTSETQVFHKSKNMFAADRAREGIVAKNLAIVVEGYTDVITMHEAGFTNVVATLGTALTQEHVRMLSRFADTIIFMFDGDNAGKSAAERAIKFANDTQSDLRCVVLPDDLDPADFLNSRGKEDMQEHLDASRPLIDFVFENRIDSYNLSIPGQKVAAFKDMCELLSVFKHSVLLDTYSTRLSDVLGIDFETAKDGISKAKSPYDDTSNTSDTLPEDDPYADIDRYYQSYDTTPEPTYDMVEGYMVDSPSEVVQNVFLTPEDMQQKQAEQELLSLTVEKPEILSGYTSSIEKIDWVEPKHKIIADAILSCIDTQSSQDMVASAIAATDDAAIILASGKMSALSSFDTNQKAVFLLTTIEMYMAKRKIRENRSKVSRMISPEEQASLLSETTALKKRVNDLNNMLASMANKTTNG